MSNDPQHPSARRRYQRGPHLFRRGETWYVRIPGHNPPEQSLRTTDGTEAVRLLGELIDGRRQPSKAAQGAAAELPLTKIAARWLEAPHGWTRRTQIDHENRAGAFVEALERRRVTLASQITAKVVDEWIHDRSGEVSRATINRDLNVARVMLAWASSDERRLCSPTPLSTRKNLREPKRRQRRVIPSPGELARVCAQAERPVALALVTQAVTGQRIDELRRLRPEQVLDSGVAVEPEGGAARGAWTTKGYEDRKVPLGPELVAIVREFVTWRTTAKGGMGKAIGLSERWLNLKIDAACAAAKVPPFRSHDLRRMFVTEAVNAGISLRVIARWVGHKDTRTTEGYIASYRSDASIQAPGAPLLVASLTPAVPVNSGSSGNS